MMVVFRMLKVYLAQDIPAFVMYCISGVPSSSLFTESTDSDNNNDNNNNNNNNNYYSLYWVLIRAFSLYKSDFLF